MFNKYRFSQLTFIIFAGLLLLIGATNGYAQKRAKEIRLQAHITGIPGDGAGGAIEVFGSDQLVTNTTQSVGGGAGSGKVEFGSVVITKTIDRATPKLFVACATGVHFPQVQVDWVRSNPRGGSEEVYFTVLLQDVQITSVRSGAPNQNDPNSETPGPVEQVSFSFGKIQWTYFLPDGTPIRGGYDLNANRPF